MADREIELRQSLVHELIVDIYGVYEDCRPQKIGYLIYASKDDENPDLYLEKNQSLSLTELDSLLSSFKSEEQKQLDIMALSIETILDNGLSPIETSKVFLLAEYKDAFDESHQLQLRLTKDVQHFMSEDKPEQSNLILLG